jgi:hypothetical protein
MLQFAPSQMSWGRQAQVTVAPHAAGRVTHLPGGQSALQNGPSAGGKPQDETKVVPLPHTPLAGTA